jgi:hypothetical protein
MSTTSSYLTVVNNLARFQKYEADQASVKTATAYYQANIGKVKSANDLLGDYRLLVTPKPSSLRGQGEHGLARLGGEDLQNTAALLSRGRDEGS